MENRDVIVVTSYYNNRVELEDTLASVDELCDVLIVDDGSDIPISSFFDELSSNLKTNCYFIRNNINEGIPSSLNKAIDWALSRQYIYYCRLDSGDLFVQGKTEKQLAFLNNNPLYVMVGSFALVRKDFKETKWITPVTDSAIRKSMHLNSPYVHSSCMIRLKELYAIKGYDLSFRVAQDYELISRLKDVGKLHNLPEFLVSYDYNDQSISSKKRKLQIKNRLRVQAQIFEFDILSYYGVIRTLLLSIVSRDLVYKIKKVLGKS